LELLVAMTVMSVVVAACLAVLFSGVRAQRFGVQLITAQQKASLAMQRLTHDLRMAGRGCSPGDTVFETAGSQEVRFWASPYSDAAPRLIRYFLRQSSQQDGANALIRCTADDSVGQVVSTQITRFLLDYLDAEGISLLDMSSDHPMVSRSVHNGDINRNGREDILDIRRVSICIQTRTRKPGRGKYTTCELKSEVAPRNVVAVASGGM
ncbi:MAG: PilW family protein, partial [bacterium]